jgi:hypothetical protein
MEKISNPSELVRVDEVDALIDELEAQFGEQHMLPEAAYPPPTGTGCTSVYTCAC